MEHVSKPLDRFLSDVFRQMQVRKINQNAAERSVLEKRYGQVWNTEELTAEFTVREFYAPYAIVIRNSDNALGSILFQHSPRYYFSFEPDQLGERRSPLCPDCGLPCGIPVMVDDPETGSYEDVAPCDGCIERRR